MSALVMLYLGRTVSVTRARRGLREGLPKGIHHRFVLRLPCTERLERSYVVLSRPGDVSRVHVDHASHIIGVAPGKVAWASSFGPTTLLSDALPRMPDLKPERNRRVHCSSLVRRHCNHPSALLACLLVPGSFPKIPNNKPIGPTIIGTKTQEFPKMVVVRSLTWLPPEV